MPGRNQTGPNGMGPLTGRGLGNCSGDRANYNNTGRKYNRFNRNACRRGFWSVEDNRSNNNLLEERLMTLENQLKELSEKIK